jgi:hypothetical protein
MVPPRAVSNPASLARISGGNPTGGATIDSRWDIRFIILKIGGPQPFEGGERRVELFTAWTSW